MFTTTSVFGFYFFKEWTLGNREMCGRALVNVCALPNLASNSLKQPVKMTHSIPTYVSPHLTEDLPQDSCNRYLCKQKNEVKVIRTRCFLFKIHKT